MAVLKYFKRPGLTEEEKLKVLKKLQGVVDDFCCSARLEVTSEECYYVEFHDGELTPKEENTLLWIIACPFSKIGVSKSSLLDANVTPFGIIEIGPRLNFNTAFCTNAVSICSSAGLQKVTRIEKSIRYLVSVTDGDIDAATAVKLRTRFVEVLHDRMTQMCYESPITTFGLDVCPDPIFEVDLINKGRSALEDASHDLGISFDSWDLDFYTDLFVEKLKRNPTSVECFDLAQSNSEHSRHWFFKGKFVIDGVEMKSSLLDMVMNTQKSTNPNNVIKFSDNSSAIEGHLLSTLSPELVVKPSRFILNDPSMKHIVFTAETHNFPTGVAPFPGATTGTGGRIRDVQATGRGARVIAGTAGYCVGCLNIKGYNLPWEDPQLEYPTNLALPSEILVDGSSGASDYGNKFGEPIICGFSRSFGLADLGGERREWIKPIMFTGGVGSMDAEHIQKFEPEVGMHVVKVGGPVLRIGVGGGSASSVSVQGDQRQELDFNAVQRGDAEMGEKMNRVVRGCVELKHLNPICSIHDQGAGGNGNVLKELVYPQGAEIKLSKFQLGDLSLSALEVWTAEYQESNALLARSDGLKILCELAAREKCYVSVVGDVTGDGKIKFIDDREPRDGDSEPQLKKKAKLHLPTDKLPIDLDLELVLGSVPKKEFKVGRKQVFYKDVSLPDNLTVMSALNSVLRLPSVASKRFLTNKVDRSVSGLIAQQQCVGPLHTPLADVAVVALSHFDIKGAATAIGEQPIKILVDPSCGARMTVGESLTNLVFACVGCLKDVKCSANWMWPAKLEGEDARLFDACVAMTAVMKDLGIGIDGGKDSLSMAAKVNGEIVKAPGSLVVSAYANCKDITKTVTPDLKCPNEKGQLFYIPLTPGKHRLGGSALAQCYKCIGNSSPDLEFPELFSKSFQVMQLLIEDGKIASGHDVSDGGLITCALEMAFAGNCGLYLQIDRKNINGTEEVDHLSVLELLFAEELGYILEVAEEHVTIVTEMFRDVQVPCVKIGYSSAANFEVKVFVDGEEVLTGKTPELRSIWEETSFELEKLQSNPACVQQEADWLLKAESPKFKLSFDPEEIMNLPIPSAVDESCIVKVAMIREEGSNGDREMASSLYMAGFQVWDVNIQDFLSSSISLDQFRGVVFVGGFSYADVFGSSKGWATVIKFNENVRKQFDEFVERSDTFSLGVCNGCQLMSYLGWIGNNSITGDDKENRPHEAQQEIMLDHNVSGRYESRFVSVRIEKSQSIMLSGMQGSVLGVWVAHGEGQFKFRDQEILQSCLDNDLVTLRYSDAHGQPTMAYPMNPNGSLEGIAGLCSRDGRHLAMMPHPERGTLMWQWPYVDRDWATKVKTSPWLCMFRNALLWCQGREA